MNKFMNMIIKWSKKLIPVFICTMLILFIFHMLALDTWIKTVFYSLTPVFLGAVIAILLQPIINQLHHYVSYKMSVYFVYFGFVLIILSVLIFAIPEIYKYGNYIIDMFPTWLEQIELIFKKYQISFQYQDLINQPYIKNSYSVVIQSAKNLLEKIGAYGFAYIIAFFISIDMPHIKKILEHYELCKSKYIKFYQTISNIIYQYIKGTLIDMLFIIFSVGITLKLANFSNPWFYAILLSILNLFPYVGATIGVFFIGFVALIQYSSFPWLLFIVIWGIQQVEANIVQPFIFHRTMHIYPLFIFIFMFLANAIFGVVGIILSPILAAFFQIIIGSYFHVKSKDAIGVWDDLWEDFDEVMKKENI